MEMDMSKMTLTDAELARLEELAAHYVSGNALPFADDAYRESACNATPALVAEVRRLRDRVEALEWFVECRDFAMWMSGSSRNVALLEAVISAEAARGAIL
jgi:hypothetical protein